MLGPFSKNPAAPTIVAVYFVAPADAIGDNYATLTFIAEDAHGGNSSSVSVSVSIVPNNPPLATPAGPIKIGEEQTSSSFALTGTDDDVADTTSLKTIVTALPTKSTLYADSIAVTVGTVFSTGTEFSVIGKQCVCKKRRILRP